MTIDDWRYGFAWIGFDKDIKGSGGHGYDKPGQAHYSFTVELVAIDNRRPMIPVPNFLWVGGNYGFGFYTTANLGGTCPDGSTDHPCRLTVGSFYSGCETKIDNTSHGYLPTGGIVVETCRADAPLPDNLTVADFRVTQSYKPCCSGSFEPAVQVELPYVGR